MEELRENVCKILSETKDVPALSQVVRNLITLTGDEDNHSTDRKVFVKDQDHKMDSINEDFLNFDEISSYLPPNCESCHDLSTYYKESVLSLIPFVNKSHEYLKQMDLSEFENKYKTCLTWTQHQEELCDLFCQLQTRTYETSLLCLLGSTMILERALGDVYLVSGSGLGNSDRQVSALLKCLLEDISSDSVIGTSVSKVLQTLMGPPQSLNLRNIAWHGFFSQGELPSNYSYFILHTIASIGFLLDSRSIKNEDIPYRNQIDIDDIKLPCDYMLASLRHRNDNSSSQEIFVEVISNSWLVNRSNKDLFSTAFTKFNDKLYGHCAVILFPLIEHSLRRMFVAANNCPDRLMTAEADTLYTTFEEILEQKLPDGRKNQISTLLGENCMDFLHDLLVYPFGPRARDRLSHGELNITKVPASLCQMLINFCGYLACKFESNMSSHMVGFKEFDEYQSLFHSISQIKFKTLRISQASSKCHEAVKLIPELNPFKSETKAMETFKTEPCRISIYFVHAFSNKYETSIIWDSVKEGFLKIAEEPYEDRFAKIEHHTKCSMSLNLRTLYRWQTTIPEDRVKESELVGLINQILSEVFTSNIQVASTLQLQQQKLVNKELSSRKRENLGKLFKLYPSFITYNNFVILLSTWFLCNIDTASIWNKESCKNVQKFLKKTLQASQNLRTLTSPMKNKWSEAEALITFHLQASRWFFENV